MRTGIEVSPRQFLQTVGGNTALKISYHIGLHASQYGRRPVEDYLEIADATFSLCRQHSAPFTGLPSSLPDVDLAALQAEAVIAVSEIVSMTKNRIRTQTDVYLKEATAFYKNSRSFRDFRRSADRLPDDEINGLILDSSDTDYVSRIDPQSLHISKERFSAPASERYFKESGTKLVHETLMGDPSIRSLMNIGSRIDPTLYFNALEFTDRKFMGFDFQHNLRYQNEMAFGSLPPNLFFASGYALDALDAGLRADACFFMATSVLFSVKELDTYFMLLARNGVRKIIISESWASPIEGYDCGAIVRPEEVETDKPFLGGTVLNAQHNYLDLLERRGYGIDSSTIIDDHFGSWYNIVQIVATLKPNWARSRSPIRWLLKR